MDRYIRTYTILILGNCFLGNLFYQLMRLNVYFIIVVILFLVYRLLKTYFKKDYSLLEQSDDMVKPIYGSGTLVLLLSLFLLYQNIISFRFLFIVCFIIFLLAGGVLFVIDSYKYPNIGSKHTILDRFLMPFSYPEKFYKKLRKR